MKPPGAPCGGWPGGGGPLVPADGACTGSARTSGKGAAGNRFCCAGGAGRGCAGAGAGRAARGALVCTTGPSSNSPAPVRSGPPPSPVAARAPAVADCGALSGGAAGLGGWLVSFFSSFSPPKIACWLPAVTQCSCRSAVVCARHHGWATRAGTRARSTFLGTDCTPAAPPVSGSQEAMPSSSCPCRPARHQGKGTSRTRQEGSLPIGTSRTRQEGSLPLRSSVRLEDGATSASYVPLGEPSLMDDHGACKRTLATRTRRSRRICWRRLICAVPCAWGTLYSSCIKRGPQNKNKRHQVAQATMLASSSAGPTCRTMSILSWLWLWHRAATLLRQTNRLRRSKKEKRTLGHRA